MSVVERSVPKLSAVHVGPMPVEGSMLMESSKVAQRTLRNPISCIGVGLHSGAKVELTMKPAPADHGISFVRTDLEDKTPLVAQYDQVTDTVMCTTLGRPDGARVGTIEHLMAAFAACHIDNALIEVSGPEVPIMDGSAQPFVFLIACAGTIDQEAPRRWIEVLKTVGVAAHGKIARLEPASGLQIDCRIEFDHPLIKNQSYHFNLTESGFEADIARARTFGFAEHVDDLRARGLILGGSLKNAVVVSQNRVLNEEGLRFENEFVRHKVLDSIGDLYLAGRPLIGRFVGRCAGHAMHNKLLHALFADPTAWRVVDSQDLDRQDLPLRRAAGA